MTDDFIGVYPKAFSEDFCKRAIQYFDDMQESGFTLNRQEHEPRSKKVHKDDEVMFTSYEKNVRLSATRDLNKEFTDVFWGVCYAEYAKKYPILHECEEHKNYELKLQKTSVGGGYHVWHAENMNKATSRRLLVWTVYLNDVAEGGETEFLYQHKRFKPETGGCLIWPAAFTHTHRGNPPISNDKYIITGWVEF